VTGRQKLFDLLAAQRRFIFLAVALLSAAGIWTATRLPSAIYPELTFPRITIVVQGSSLGARQVVFSITRPIEEAVSIVPGVTRVRSRSIRGARARISGCSLRRSSSSDAVMTPSISDDGYGPRRHHG